ncbi:MULTISPECIES: hypothetical protein [unclassified Candidatus Frackibacter]|uniref:hypothetical protein n=1 Tax=unclassified Candidatus Frackibacter TaxID=2648818 RepID=UPI00087F59AD|nr:MULTISPECIES: hypothetical protein [unclassified Candidatus Frackibacter]SDC12209.1 hypothetical protein SAMN04515661_102174 [Candidatus Frackibacter sp. WG11]SEM35973.1 hypothetical protein SAMN04488698_10237 [Candidatus Frackibacter sp. WG12]SFL41218.1 hypothetical protein SAMN04488699_10237 [Candidatus Frackibacter sp. WG13]
MIIKRKHAIILILILITMINFINYVHANGLINPSGRLKWVSEYNKNNNAEGTLELYGDYEFSFTGSLVTAGLGSYNLDFNYRDYLKSLALQPTVTTYNLSTNLFPQSPFSVVLGVGKSDTEYKTDSMPSPIDTTSKHSAFSFFTPLPYGMRFSYSLNNSQQYDYQREEINKEDQYHSFRLSKNIVFDKIVKVDLRTNYRKSTEQNHIKNTKSNTDTMEFHINNSLLNTPLSLTDVDINYRVDDEEDKEDRYYELKTIWKPLDYLTTRITHSQDLSQEKVNGKLNTISLIESTDINFSVQPYTILSYDGGLSYINNEDKKEVVETLSGNFGVQFSYWDNAPINFNLSHSIEKNETSGNLKEEDTSVSLNSNIKVGNLNVNPSYNYTNINTSGEGQDSSNQQLDLGLNYARNLTNKLYLTGSTTFRSDLNSFKYDPNYDIRLRYLPWSSLKLIVGTNGYQKEATDRDEEAINYKRYHSTISYSINRMNLDFTSSYKDDLENNEIKKELNLNGTYYFRAVELNLNTVWDETINKQTNSSQENFEVTTAIIRRF